MSNQPAPGGRAEWYVIWYHPFADVKDVQFSWAIVQLASPPAAGSVYRDGIVNQVEGPYSTKAAAQAAIGTTGTSGKGGGPNGTDTSNPQANKTPKLPDPLAAIGDFFGRLAEGSTWIRVAEVLLGLGLIVVGLSHLAAGTPIGRAATTAGKAAALL